MLKYSIAIMGIFVSATALAGAYRVTSEQRFLNTDGSAKYPGISSIQTVSLTSEKPGTYSLFINEKIKSDNGTTLVNVDQNGGLYTAEQVESLGSIGSTLCTIMGGQLETLTVKAGTFKTCKRQSGDFTEWNAEGIPYRIKLVQQNVDGSMVMEAVEVKTEN